jgi:predicted nucleic acid-binding protein
MNAAYLLDTNVLSELMRDSPSSVVMAWFAQRPQAAMKTSAITHAEILTRKKGTLPFKGTEKRGKVASSLLKQAFLWGGLQPARAD